MRTNRNRMHCEAEESKGKNIEDKNAFNFLKLKKKRKKQRVTEMHEQFFSFTFFCSSILR